MGRWHRFWLLGISTIAIGGCGTDSPTATNPINDRVTQVRTMTPRIKPFSELDDDKQPPTESLLATFVISPEQLAQMAEQSTSIPPEIVGSCVDCAFDPDPQPSQDRETKRLGTYTPDDLSLQLQLRIPESTSVGRVEGSVRFEINTSAQLINPGYGAQLKILNAVLQDAAESPQQQVEATSISEAMEFDEKEITKGQSSTRSLSLSFGEVSFQPRYLRLEVMLTSPIPRANLVGKVVPPPTDESYHGLWLDKTLGLDRAGTYREQLGKSLAWIGWTQEWSPESEFPLDQATSVRSSGAVPYLRLLLPESGEAAEAIRSGEHDEVLRAWGEAIRGFRSPVILAVGPGRDTPATEAAEAPEGSNDPDASQQTTYRYVLEQFQQHQIPNLTWVYHPNLEATDLSRDYPGDAWVDWIGLEIRIDPFSDQTVQGQMDELYPRVAALSARKPILLTSLGLTALPESVDQIPWLQESLQQVIDKRWPRLIGFAWDGSTTNLADLPELVEIVNTTIGGSGAVLGRVMTQTPFPAPAPSPSSPPPGAEIAPPPGQAPPSQEIPSLPRPSPTPIPRTIPSPFPQTAPPSS